MISLTLKDLKSLEQTLAKLRDDVTGQTSDGPESLIGVTALSNSR